MLIFVCDSWSCWFLFILMVVLVMDHAIFEELRIILLMDYDGDEVRVRVSSLSCKLLVQVMSIAWFILVFAYVLIYWSWLWCLWCLGKMEVSSSWPKVRVLSKMHDLDQLMLNLRCVYVTEKGVYLIWIWRGIVYGFFCMRLGCTQVYLYTVKEEFELRIGEKNEETL